MSDWAWVIEIPHLDFDSREQWLDARRNYIGASDIPIIMGVAPWGSALELWGQKTGRVERNGNEIERMRWGQILEGPISREYSLRTLRPNCRPISRYQMQVFPNTPYACTVDFWQEIDGHPTILEIKTASAFTKTKWLEEPPIEYQLQVQWQMFVTGLQRATITCLLGGEELVWADIERNEGTISVLRDAADRFWECVQTDTPPPVDGREATRDALQQLYRGDIEEPVLLPSDAETIHLMLAETKENIRGLTERKLYLENQIKALLGDHTVGIIPGTNIEYRWKWQERKAHEVKASRTRVLTVGKGKE